MKELKIGDCVAKLPIVQGGIFDGKDIAHVLELGADGAQMASRFVATEECDASPAYIR